MADRADLNDLLITVPRENTESALVALMAGVAAVLGMAANAGTQMAA